MNLMDLQEVLLFPALRVLHAVQEDPARRQGEQVVKNIYMSIIIYKGHDMVGMMCVVLFTGLPMGPGRPRDPLWPSGP